MRLDSDHANGTWKVPGNSVSFECPNWAHSIMAWSSCLNANSFKRITQILMGPHVLCFIGVCQNGGYTLAGASLHLDYAKLCWWLCFGTNCLHISKQDRPFRAPTFRFSKFSPFALNWTLQMNLSRGTFSPFLMLPPLSWLASFKAFFFYILRKKKRIKPKQTQNWDCGMRTFFSGLTLMSLVLALWVLFTHSWA